MPEFNSIKRFILSVLLVLLSITSLPANVQASSSGIVIYEVYGGGGLSGATYRNDFVVLFNAGNSPYTINSWSLQYTSATGTGLFSQQSITTINGVTLQPGQYYLIQLASNGSSGSALPTPDLTNTSLNMANNAGKVVLVTGTAGLACNGSSTPCNASQLARIVDLVGYGSANFYEGAGAAPAISSTTAAIRKNGGCTDTDNNNADFTAGAVTPLNTSSPFHLCGPPVVSSITRANPDPTNAASVNFTVTFSAAVTGVDVSDFSLTATGVTGAAVTGVSGSGNTYSVSVSTGSGDGTLRLDVVDDDSIINSSSTPLGGAGAGNGNFTSGQVYTIDKTPPQLSISSTAVDPTNQSPIPVTFNFTEPVTGFTLSDIVVSNGNASNFAGTGSSYSANITPVANGLVSINVPANRATDAAGNGNLAAAQFDIRYDNIPPTVTVAKAAGQDDPTANSPIHFTVTFSEPIRVSSFTSSDITLGGTAGATTATITEDNPHDGTTFNVAVSGMASSGTVTLRLAAGVVQDLAGNSNLASNTTNNSVTYDITIPEVLSIALGNTNPTNLPVVQFVVSFSKPVTGVDVSDFVITSSGLSGAAVSSINGSGANYTVLVNTGTGSGTLRLDLIDDDSIIDLLLNPLGGTGVGNGDFSTGPEYTIIRATQASDGGVIVNEISNGSSGNKEWVELIVVGSQPTVDLSGWIIDDNNGDFDSLAAGKGIASGHVRFASPLPACLAGQSLAAAPVGARIIIYNSDDVDGFLAGHPNDPCDTDGDKVYYLPVGSTSNTNHLQRCVDQPRVSPVPATSNYSGCVYTTASAWSELNLRNLGDAMQTRRPDSLFFHGFAYGDLVVPPAPNFPDGSPSFNVNHLTGANSAYQFSCGNYFSNSSGQFLRISHDSANPGIANSVYNAAFIRALELGTFNFGNMNDPENCRIEPEISATFAKPQIYVGQSVQLTVTLRNPYPSLDGYQLNLSGVSFTNNLPAGLVLSGANPASNTCGGTFTGTTGGSSFGLTGINIDSEMIPDNSTCEIVINVTARSSGSFTVDFPIGAVTSALTGVSGGSNLAAAAATLQAIDSPTSTSTSTLPSTGFAPGQKTLLPQQPKYKQYDQSQRILLEIPRLGLTREIVGVPITSEGWDLTWLNKNIGWLEGTAFPTWAGNSVLTAHVYDSNGQPGPFAGIHQLRWGDQIIVHAWGQQYVYEVREVRGYVSPSDKKALGEKTYPWLTLITCRGYDEDSDTYRWRVVVQAVQVEIR